MVKWFTKLIKYWFWGFAFFTAIQIEGQTYPGFSQEQIDRLNTAQEVSYLSEAEKENVLLMNLMRFDGATFWDSIAEPYIVQFEIPRTRYTRSLEKDLKATSGLKVLQPEEALYRAAHKHAVASGNEGKLGHTSSAGTFEQRLKPLATEFNYLLENCDYGSSTAMDILMNLMIDEGLPEVGHRKNILHKEVDAVGVAIAPHTTYQHTCVQVFGLVRD